MTIITIVTEARCKHCFFLKQFMIGKRKAFRCDNNISPEFTQRRRLRDIACNKIKL